MIRHIIKLIWNKKSSSALMLLELFLSFIVLSAVLTYVLSNLEKVLTPLGIETEDRWAIRIDELADKDSTELVEIRNILYTELKGMEKIKSVGFGNSLGVFTGSMNTSADDSGGFEIRSILVAIDHEFAETMGMKFLKGRNFTEDDYLSATPPLIVNQKFIDEYYRGKDMIDSVIVYRGEWKIIGIVDQYRYNGEFTEEEPTTISLSPRTERNMSVVYLHMEKETNAAYEEQVNKLVSSVLKSEANIISNVEKMKVRKSLDQWISMIVLLSLCGFLCLNVALGLFGVLWYTINKRKSEIGLRRAIGAHSSDIMKQFVLEILVLTLLAVSVGIFFAIQIPLLKIGPFDPRFGYMAILFSTLIIFGIVIICALFPSWQASKIDPSMALHEN